jgi:hypothetical protein
MSPIDHSSIGDGGCEARVKRPMVEVDRTARCGHGLTSQTRSSSINIKGKKSKKKVKKKRGGSRRRWKRMKKGNGKRMNKPMKELAKTKNR